MKAWFALSALLIGLVEAKAQSSPCAAPHPYAGDVSPHRERFIRVFGACLSLLDWGGHGPVMVFLPGYGDSAHIFDDIAPAFTDRFHVVGLTPRGFPPSNAPAHGYTIAQLANDVVSVIDTLGSRSAILVGHSISGAVITQFGESHPHRLAAAVYLDAAFDFGPGYQRGRRPGKPTPLDTTSSTYRAWQGRYSDSLLSRTILNAARTEDLVWQLDSAEAARRHALVAPLVAEVRSHQHQPWQVTAPVLSLYALGSFDRAYGWLTPLSDQWDAALANYAANASDIRAEQSTLVTRARNAKTIEFDSGHYVFIDRRDAILAAMRKFLLPALSRVPPPARPSS